MRRALLSVVFVFGVTLVSVEGSSAQTVAHSFDELTWLVTSSEAVYVTDRSGQITKGRVVSATSTSLVLMSAGTRRTLTPMDVRTVHIKRSDPLTNGLLIGLAAGAGGGALLGFGSESQPVCGGEIHYGCGKLGPQTNVVGWILLGAVVGMAAGTGIDALITPRRLVYEKNASAQTLHITAAPIVQRGMGVSVSVTLRR